jgi:hypothetical protein
MRRYNTTSQKTVIFRLPNIIHFEDDSFLRCTSMRLHRPISQKNVIFILTTMRNWNLKFCNSSNTSSYLYTHPGATNWSDWHQTVSGTHDAAVSCLLADKYRGCVGGRQSKKYEVTKKNSFFMRWGSYGSEDDDALGCDIMTVSQLRRILPF